MTSIACLIATWRDGELLRDAVASVHNHVDTIVVLDGAYAAIADGDNPPWTELHEFWPLSEFDVELVQGNRPWPGEIEKRNVLLELARAFLPAGEHWALVLDADEVLVHGELLRLWVESGHPWGLPRVEPDGTIYWAPSRLFRLGDFTRYADRSYWLAEAPGSVRAVLEHERAAEQCPRHELTGPWVDHRWDRRPPWRREVQRRYGRILADRDHG